MPDPRTLTEATTLAELREQLLLLDVVSVRVSKTAARQTAAVPEARWQARLHHDGVGAASEFYVGTGSTLATAIEAACIQLRRVLGTASRPSDTGRPTD